MPGDRCIHSCLLLGIGTFAFHEQFPTGKHSSLAFPAWGTSGDPLSPGEELDLVGRQRTQSSPVRVLPLVCTAPTTVPEDSYKSYTYNTHQISIGVLIVYSFSPG